jgi:hypothetical protein
MSVSGEWWQGRNPLTRETAMVSLDYAPTLGGMKITIRRSDEAWATEAYEGEHFCDSEAAVWGAIGSLEADGFLQTKGNCRPLGHSLSRPRPGPRPLADLSPLRFRRSRVGRR